MVMWIDCGLNSGSPGYKFCLGRAFSPLRFSSLGSKLSPQIFDRDSKYFAVLSVDQQERLTFYVLTVMEPKVQIKVTTQLLASEAPTCSKTAPLWSHTAFPLREKLKYLSLFICGHMNVLMNRAGPLSS